ncbi:MAG: hypothetical protein ACAH80_11125 [Alphaproteobacteria bacterium]
MKALHITMKCLLLLAFLSMPPVHQSYARARVETHEVIVKSGEIYQGLQFPEGTKLHLISANNAVASAILSHDFLMNGHLIKGGTTLQIWNDGTLMEIYTQDGQRINDLVFTQGEASLRFSAEGKLATAHLNKPKEIQGFRLAENSNVEFYPDGKLAWGKLADEQLRDGLYFAALSEIRLFPSGKLQQAKLAKESKFGELLLKGDPNANPGETSFWPEGNLKTGILAAAATIQGFPCGPGPITFFESGRIKTLVLGEEMKIVLAPYEGQTPHEKLAKAGDSLNINENGVVIGWGGP